MKRIICWFRGHEYLYFTHDIYGPLGYIWHVCRGCGKCWRTKDGVRL